MAEEEDTVCHCKQSKDGFIKTVILVSLIMGFLLVAGILFGPWEIDPHSTDLVAIIMSPGGVALGTLLNRK